MYMMNIPTTIFQEFSQSSPYVVWVNVESNVNPFDKGGALYIKVYGADINITKCVYTNSTTALGAVIYFDENYMI